MEAAEMKFGIRDSQFGIKNCFSDSNANLPMLNFQFRNPNSEIRNL